MVENTAEIAAAFHLAYGLPQKRPAADPQATVTIPLATYEALLRKIENLERQVFLDSWRTNPDRMGS
jgi:hypothetical protein